MFGERVYLLSPAWVKTTILGLYGLYERVKRRGTFYRVHYYRLSNLLRASLGEVEQYQSDRLRELLLEAYDYSPYYRDIFYKKSIERDNLLEVEPKLILQKLPYLEKKDLRANLSSITSANPRRRARAVVSTSGTTGSPLQVLFDSESRQATFAEWRRYYDWLGLPKTFKSVRFSGRIIVDPTTKSPPFWVYNWAERQLFMSTYHLKEDYLAFYVDKLNKYKPDFIDGYPSAIYLLARFILQSKTKISFKPIAISVTAESFLDYQRAAIESAFGCKAYNQYASSEGAPWIVECMEGNYHLWIDTGVFQFKKKYGLGNDSYVAELVLSSFRNFKVPLIKYRIGDCVVLDHKSSVCACGCPLPFVKAIVGREDDILYTYERGYVGRLDPVYKGIKGIIQSKIIQYSPQKLEVLLVVDENFNSKEELRLKRNLQDRLGGVDLHLNRVNSIPLGKAGKLKSVERRFSIDDFDETRSG